MQTSSMPLARASRWRVLALVGALVGVAAVAAGISSHRRAEAATVTAAYVAGHRQVTINGYGARGLGTFVLRFDPGDPATGERLALCLEAHASHSTEHGRYRLVANRVDSPQLDYLLWRYGWPGTAEHTPIDGDHDTATALAALAWYYADASRRGGGAVWSNPADGSAAVSPIAPHAWDALPPYTTAFPVGLRSGPHHLDGAERRVHELYLEAEARRGPWAMSAVAVDGQRAAVTVAGPGGPIAGVGGVRFVVRDRTGVTVANVVARTDADGVASVAIDPLVDGGSVEVSMFAPGVHQEWDGDGEVQRMSTATNSRLDRRVEIPPARRYVSVHKRSSDPLFGVAGARFALLDARDRTVATVTSDDDGIAQFPPLDTAAHAGPYRVREVRAPAGLAGSDHDAVVPEPVSTDRRRPTAVTIHNDPVEYGLRVRKELSDPRVGPPDRSGFVFEVVREDDGRSFGTVTTRADGRTPRLAVTVGRYRVCERARPPWAMVTHDAGCRSVDVPGETHGEVEVAYTNEVPVPSITTRVHDADDGDRVLAAGGGVLVDVVTFADVVPGTEYVLHGEIQARHGDDAQPTGITGSTAFVPSEPDGQTAVRFDVPAGAGIDVGVVFQHLLVAGEVVASHADPDDADQTFHVPSIDTAATLTEHGVVDEVRYRGLPAGEYEARVAWHRRDADGTCVPVGLVDTTSFTAVEHHGTVVVGPTDVDEALLGTTLVAFQELHPVPAGGQGDGAGGGGDASTPLAVHADCDADAQTVAVPGPASTVPVTTTPVSTPGTTLAPATTAPATTTPATTPATTAPATTAPATTTPATTTPATTATTTTVTTVRGLPATGDGIQMSTALALLALGAGVLAVLGAAWRRPRRG